MIPNEMAEQVRSEVRRLKEAQDQFLRTYQQLCVHHGGPDWRRKATETVFNDVRRDIIPLMEQAGLGDRPVQALCSWAEALLLRP